MQLLEISPKGYIRKTPKHVFIPDKQLHQVVMWGSQVLGPAEFTYPHPNGWVVTLSDKSYNLTQLSVKILTAVFRSHLEIAPTCISA